MRRILDAGRDRAVPLLLLGAIATAFVRDFDIFETRKATQSLGMDLMLLVVGAVLSVALMVYLGFHIIAGVAMIVGRMLDGKASFTAVRTALAWGLAPVIWALLYRIPFAIWVNTSEGLRNARAKLAEGMLRIEPGFVGQGCGLVMLVAFLDLIVIAWTLFVSSNTLAEANGISTARGFAILAITFVAPLIVTVAAVLAIFF